MMLFAAIAVALTAPVTCPVVSASATADGAAGGALIVNLSSISWMIGVEGVPVYTTAEAAVEGLKRRAG